MITTIPKLISFGYCSKTFGYKGEIKLMLSLKYLKKGNPRFIWCYQLGKAVPYFVEEFTLLNENECSIKLEDITNENDASQFRNKEFFIDKELIEKHFIAPKLNKNIVGFIVKQYGNTIGELKEIQEFKIGHPIMLIHSKKDDILIPFVEEFINKIDEVNKIIEVTLPEGLLDLYS